MIGYWTQFAKTLNPNSPGAPAWSKYSLGGSIESLVAPAPVTESDADFDADHKMFDPLERVLKSPGGGMARASLLDLRRP